MFVLKYTAKQSNTSTVMVIKFAMESKTTFQTLVPSTKSGVDPVCTCDFLAPVSGCSESFLEVKSNDA